MCFDDLDYFEFEETTREAEDKDDIFGDESDDSYEDEDDE